MTQQQVADALGVNYSTVCGYETGKSEPNALRISMMAKLFGVTGDYLICADDQMQRTEPDETETRVLAALNACNAEGRREIVEHAEYIASREKYKKTPSSSVTAG